MAEFIVTLLAVLTGGGISIFGQWLVDRRSNDLKNSEYYFAQARLIIELLRTRSHCLIAALTEGYEGSKAAIRQLESDHSIAMLVLHLNSTFPELMEVSESYFKLSFEGLQVAQKVSLEEVPFDTVSEDQRRKLVEAIAIAERPIIAGLAEVIRQLSPSRPSRMKSLEVSKRAQQQLPKNAQ